MRSRDRFRRGERQQRPQPFAAGDHAVAHRLGTTAGARRRRHGRKRSSAASTARRRASSQAADRGNEIAVTSCSGSSPSPSDARRGLDLAALVEHFDAALGLFELGVAEARELHAALEELERLLEREIAFLERLDDRLELGDGGLEVLDRRDPSCVHVARYRAGLPIRGFRSARRAFPRHTTARRGAA